MMIVKVLPTINVTLNALAGILLFFGWRAIKAGKRDLHRNFMISAFVCSILFLCCYLTYHYLIHGVVTRYQGEGFLRILYFSILLTHTPLAAIVPIFAIKAVIHAVKKDFQKHVRVTRWLYPVWMYVSVTGVLIYLMLYVF